MNVNADPKAAMRQVMMQTMMRAMVDANDDEAESLLGDVGLMVETIAAESAVKRFTRTEEERRQDNWRDARNKADLKKRLASKEFEMKRNAAHDEEMEHLKRELERDLAAALVVKA